MKNLIPFLFIILFASTALAQKSVTPRFEDYPATIYEGMPAAPKVNGSKEARKFRTRLHEGTMFGVNFAGRYTVVQWGCGAGCVQAAFVDRRTGAVFFPKELDGFGVWFWDNNEEALRVKPDSRLLIVSGFPASEGKKENPKSGLYYYEWTGSRLRLVKLVEKKREDAH